MIAESSFGQVVKERRSILGLTQTELARRVGCAAITIRKIEADGLRPSVQMAELIALALNIPEAEQLAFVRLARADVAPSPIPTPAPLPSEIGLTDLSGRAVKGFQLGERIGSGGFGVVYRALQPSVEREVAVKIILPRYANHPNFIRRFEAEAQLIARLEHPHIVPLYDYWREPDAAYLIMRLLRGGSLEDQLKNGPIPLPLISQYTRQIGLALDVAHRNGIIHRDIKPANVLLDEEANAYLADFGIAKNLEGVNGHSLTEDGALIGSPAYISPEQILAEPVKAQSDIYCLGIMLFEMLTGHKPFTGPTPIAYIQQHLNETLPSLQAHNPDLLPALDEVIHKATARNMADRYRDVPALVSALQQVLPTAVTDAASAVPSAENLIQTEPPLELSTQEWAELENPYQGLRAFSEADAGNFHGRATLIQELFAHLSDGSELARFLAIVGPSGSGKSSVAKAGLVPALRRGGLPGSENWFVLDFTPGTHPWEELEAALLRIAVNPPETLLTQLQEGERGLLRAVNRVLPEDGLIELVLVIDQFEELFTLVVEEAVREQFLNSLVTAVLDERTRLRVIITLRADFYDRPLQYVDFGDVIRQRTVSVLPMTADELEQAITRPAAQAGVRLEPGLAAAIIRDVGDQPGTLPLLQYALTELFEQRDKNVMTRTAYDAAGGVAGALARRADEIYEGLNEDGQSATRQLFLRLITLGEGVEDTRRRVRLSEVEGLSVIGVPFTDNGSPNTEYQLPITEYGKHRLLTFDHDPITREPTVEVAHEALLREWGRLRGWLAESRDDIRRQRLLADAATQWTNAGQDASYLLRGNRLIEFAAWAETTTLVLTGPEQSFLQVSLDGREQRQTEEQARQQRELATARQLAETERRRAEEQSQAAHRLRRRAFYLVGALLIAVVLAVAAVVAGRQAIQSSQEAESNLALAVTREAEAQENAQLAATRQAEAETEALARATQQAIAETNFIQAEAQRLASEATNLINANGSSETAALLALRSLNLKYTPQGDAALLQAINLQYPSQIFTGHTDTVTQVAFSPDDQTILTGSEDGTARLFDVQSGQQLQLFSGHTSEIYAIAFSPDGKSALTGSIDNTARLWNVATGQVIQTFVGHTSYVITVAFSPDGRQILTGSEDSTMRLWDAQTGRELNQWFLEDPVSTFSADGRYAIGYSETDNANHLWDTEALTRTHSFSYPSPPDRRAIQFSPDGKQLLAGFVNQMVLLDVASGREMQVFQGHTEAIRKLAFSPDGKYVLSASVDKTARLWDVQTGEEIRQFRGHAGIVHSTAFSSDGKQIVTGGNDGTVRLWDIAPRSRLPILNGQQGEMYGVAFSPDGKYLATNVINHVVQLWDLASGQTVWDAQGSGLALWALEFSPDGRYLGSANMDGIATLWDVETGAEVRSFTTQGLDEIGALAFSPDGKTMIAGGRSATTDETVVPLWEVSTGRELFRFPAPAFVWAVAFSPDGNHVLIGSTNGVSHLWDVQNRTKLHEFVGVGAAFSPDGSKAITIDGSTGLIWDVQTGQEIGRFIGAAAGIDWSARYAPDGNSVAAASLDLTTVRLWDIQTGQELRRYPHTPAPNYVVYSPDSQYLATVSNDGTARLWDVDYRTTMDYLCSRLLRDFTTEERAQYGIPDDEPTCPGY